MFRPYIHSKPGPFSSFRIIFLLISPRLSANDYPHLPLSPTFIAADATRPVAIPCFTAESSSGAPPLRFRRQRDNLGSADSGRAVPCTCALCGAVAVHTKPDAQWCVRLPEIARSAGVFV